MIKMNFFKIQLEFLKMNLHCKVYNNDEQIFKKYQFKLEQYF